MFKDVAAVNFSLAGVGRDESMKRSFVFMISENFFPLMGVKPAARRFFTAEESRPNAAHAPDASRLAPRRVCRLGAVCALARLGRAP